MKPQVRQILSRIGNKRIISLCIVRSPINSAIQSIVRLISNVQHDTLFHLYIIFNVQNEKGYWVLEKNEDINMKPYVHSKINEIRRVEITSMTTINQMITNTLDMIGEHDFYDYNAFSTNCQHFVYSVLKANNMMNENLKQFIIQKVDNLVNQWKKRLVYWITSLKNRINQEIEGKGISPTNVIE
jgi:hypothetical protein